MRQSSLELLALYDAMEKCGMAPPGMEKDAGLEKLTGLFTRLFSRGGARAAEAAGGAAARPGILTRLKDFFGRWGAKGAPSTPAPNTFSVAQMRGAGGATPVVKTPLVGAAAKTPVVKPGSGTIATSLDRAHPASNISRANVAQGHAPAQTRAQINRAEGQRLQRVKAKQVQQQQMQNAALTADEIAAQNARVAAQPNRALLKNPLKSTPKEQAIAEINKTYAPIFEKFERTGYNTIRKQLGGISTKNFRDVAEEMRQIRAKVDAGTANATEKGILSNYNNAFKQYQEMNDVLKHYQRLGLKAPETTLKQFNSLKNWIERPYNPKLVRTSTPAAEAAKPVAAPEVKVAPAGATMKPVGAGAAEGKAAPAAAAEGEAAAAGGGGVAMPNGNGNQVVNINSGNGASGAGGGLLKPVLAGGLGAFLANKLGGNGGGGQGMPIVINTPQPAYSMPQVGIGGGGNIWSNLAQYM